MDRSTPLSCRSSLIDSSRSSRAIAAALSLLLWAPAVGFAVPVDADQPMHIRAQAAEFDHSNGRAVYLGGVEVRQGTLQVTGERMTAHYRNARLVRVTASGEPARYQQGLAQDRGLVRASASLITYHPGKERIELSGEARLAQAQNDVAGEVIHYDIASGTVDAEATGQSPVRVILRPARGD